MYDNKGKRRYDITSDIGDFYVYGASVEEAARRACNKIAWGHLEKRGETRPGSGVFFTAGDHWFWVYNRHETY